jgi:hypothetical protein
MIRTLYRGLLWLHPPFFRRQFGDEMLWIFDQASSSRGALALFADGLASLARQWLLRSGWWKVAVALALAMLQVSLGGLAMSRLGPRHILRLGADPARVTLGGLAHQRITVTIVMYLTLFVLGGLVLMIIGLTWWAKGVSARRRPAVLRVR